MNPRLKSVIALTFCVAGLAVWLLLSRATRVDDTYRSLETAASTLVQSTPDEDFVAVLVRTAAEHDGVGGICGRRHADGRSTSRELLSESGFGLSTKLPLAIAPRGSAPQESQPSCEPGRHLAEVNQILSLYGRQLDYGALETELADDPQRLALVSEWRSCMGGHGSPYESIDQMHASLRARTQDLLPRLSGTEAPTASTLAALKGLQNDERAAAVADWDCREAINFRQRTAALYTESQVRVMRSSAAGAEAVLQLLRRMEHP